MNRLGKYLGILDKRTFHSPSNKIRCARTPGKLSTRLQLTDTGRYIITLTRATKPKDGHWHCTNRVCCLANCLWFLRLSLANDVTFLGKVSKYTLEIKALWQDPYFTTSILKRVVIGVENYKSIIKKLGWKVLRWPSLALTWEKQESFSRKTTFGTQERL